ncbi:MAG: DUF1080 domain-containing protein [Sedimentisphaerales bacterium]
MKNRKYYINSSKIVVATSALILSSVLYSSAGSAESRFIQEAKNAVEAADPFMGDWQGTRTITEGAVAGPNFLAAQVIAMGKGKYRLNLLKQFDTNNPPVAALDGQSEDAEVKFTGPAQQEGAQPGVQALIKNGKLTGTIKEYDSQGKCISSADFALEKTFRISPTLGMESPPGAIVLFDGKNFDQWEHAGMFAGRIGIAEFVGSLDNAVAYLRCSIWSDKQQQATLELGSDDGVKVWLNGELVHANNIGRALKPGEDKKQVTLKAQWNELLLKVTNGGGGWEACVRLANNEGKLFDGIKEKASAEPGDAGTGEYYKKNNGFLTFWDIAGPYQQQDKDFKALFDVVFDPEKSDAKNVQWKRVDLNNAKPENVRWKLVDGAMEVTPGSGSIVTKRKFKDYKLHLEFRLSFMPEARGQARANSGVYMQGRYEVQVLDSFGILKSRNDECGGIYGVGAPRVIMCAPPLQWQTYDITFQAPRFDAAGNKVESALLSVVHNGITIHENLKVPGPTTLALDNNVKDPGGICLQDHGNLVQFRNIWLVELP